MSKLLWKPLCIFFYFPLNNLVVEQLPYSKDLISEINLDYLFSELPLILLPLLLIISPTFKLSDQQADSQTQVL